MQKIIGKLLLIGCLFIPFLSQSQTTYPTVYTFTDGSTFSTYATELVNDGMRGGRGVASVVIGSEVTSLGRDAFAWCGSLTNINIPDKVTTIGEGALAGTGITSIIISTNVTSIGISAFQACIGLTNVVIPNGVTTVGRYAFLDCANLTNIIVGQNVSSFGHSVFANCSSLGSIRFLGNAPSVDNGGDWINCPATINRFSITTGWSSTLAGRPVEISDYLEGDFTFALVSEEATITGYVGSGGSVSIPPAINGYPVTSLGNPNPWTGVFSYNNSITNVIVANGVRSLGLRTFDHCSNLQNVTLPESITNIGRNAFGYCSSLTSINLPSGVTSIEQETFRDCYNLAFVNLPNTLSSIGNEAFSNCSSLSNILIPPSTSYIGEGAFAFSGLITIDLSTTTANILFSLFYNCTSLVSAKLPANMEVVRGWLFYGCSSLSEIVIPAGVYSIQNGAFQNCSSLSKIYFLGNAPNNGTGTQFQGCPATLYIFPSATGWGASYAGRPTAIVPVEDILTSPNKFQLFSVSQLDSNRIAGRSDVTNNPLFYGLYNSAQYNGNFTAGQQSVLQNPNAHSLYTTNQIQNLGLGGIILNRNTNNQLVLNYQILQSADLQNWSPYQQYELPITNAPTDKMFLRVQAVGQ